VMSYRSSREWIQPLVDKIRDELQERCGPF
jgi:hypothetical protein